MTTFLSLINSCGITVYILLILAFITLALTIDKIIFYKKCAELPQNLLDIIESYNFSWQEFDKNLSKLPAKNIYRIFFTAIIQNRARPLWWLESRVADEAKIVEKQLALHLWILETITTAAPLLGLFGTIIGMMTSFKLIGAEGLLNHDASSGITAGVADALVATALGIIIAIFSLFVVNYFSRMQDHKMDELERFATKVIDHIKLDEKK